MLIPTQALTVSANVFAGIPTIFIFNTCVLHTIRSSKLCSTTIMDSKDIQIPVSQTATDVIEGKGLLITHTKESDCHPLKLNLPSILLT